MCCQTFAASDVHLKPFMRSLIRLAICVLIGSAARWAAAEETASDIFARRILPLAKADKPSSCRECHAAGVDLSQYIKDDAATTFAALPGAGLVSAEQP